MYTSIVEFIAIVLFIGGFWHAVRYEGRAFAQQWFLTAWLAIFIRETLNQLIFQVSYFAPSILRLGAAPVLIALLWASVFYLAYQFARRLVDTTQSAFIVGLLFLITASFALPLEATAAQLRWWLYDAPSHIAFGGVPLAALLVWGGSAAIFYAVFWRARQARLPERGRLYLLITLSPVIAVAQVLLMVLLNV